MAKPIKGELPPGLVLASGYKIRLLALDATTFAAIAGVTLGDISFLVTPLEQPLTAEGDAPMPLLVPTNLEA